MPELSRFYGIVVFMVYADHRPAHFHARYGDDEVSVGLDAAMRVEGRFPRRALGLLLEWAQQHREALLANWEQASRREPLVPIPPLE